MSFRLIYLFPPVLPPLAGGLLPLPPPDGFPVRLGQFGLLLPVWLLAMLSPFKLLDL